MQKERVTRETLLRRAAEVFFEQGYAATSIDAIIERVGGSKRNIYREFGSKEGLFTAIVTANVEKALSPLVGATIEAEDLRGALIRFGCGFMEMLLSPALLGVYRTVVAEHVRFPELVRKFYEHGPRQAGVKLSEVFEEARQRGDIEVDDCAVVADQFVGLIRGNLHMQVVLGLRATPDAEELRALVTSAVDVFLDGVSNPSQPQGT